MSRRLSRRAWAEVGNVAAVPLLLPERSASRGPAAFEPLHSQMASAAQTDHPSYLAWLEEIEHTRGQRYHRKAWEWCYVLEAFRESGLLVPGSRAVGFGVGREPIPAVLASRGLTVVATDQPSDGAIGWSDTGQHAAALEELLLDTICPQDRFAELVTFQPVDMSKLPRGLTGSDLLWSSCALEHLGSPQRGTQFVIDSLRCLRPGGVAVHTTELRLDGVADADLGGTVLYSIDTMKRLVARLRLRGHLVRANFHVPWEGEADRYIDEPPFAEYPYHLKLRVEGVVTTSFGLIVRKRGA